jgi:hypothetical protein
MLSVREQQRGDRPDSNRYREAHNLGCSPLHHGHHGSGDDRTRTGGLPADNRVLWPSELRPLEGTRISMSRHVRRGIILTRVLSRAGGIRTHGLELMRLARTAAPPPRRSAWLESNQRFPAPEAGGVAVSPTGRWSNVVPPAGLEPAASRLRAGRHLQLDHGGINNEAPAAGLEPAPRE